MNERINSAPASRRICNREFRPGKDAWDAVLKRVSLGGGVVQEPACCLAGHSASGDSSAQLRISLLDAGIVSKDSFHFQIASFVRLKFQSLVDVFQRLGIFFLMPISERQSI